MDLIFDAEIVGSIAFAVSGAIVAMERRLDFFGIIILAVITTVGGGIVRDLLLGNIPPVAFTDPVYLFVAIGTALAVVLLHKRTADKRVARILASMRYFDAIGLGIFTAVGLVTAIQLRPGEPYLAVSVAVMTGVGGGVLRDILANRVPLILRREIYAVASIVGAVIGYFAYRISRDFAILTCVVIVVAIRLYAIHKDIHLPNFREKS
ncbi:trimeric intracellular cation channel family protein [Gehongia tenuis]|uniref:Trimeric intracellular cation channel family protein n=1 Tax=Gehongia tenuis TaxID=2763655 RepID=A0A926HPP7_9FIRM|nr:trimeric intracellular cation channel family protein [Gehongia tenuis]MBC8531438.1 trimeric intracellular cation channel family protein [Gehongia tenuis]